MKCFLKECLNGLMDSDLAFAVGFVMFGIAIFFTIKLALFFIVNYLPIFLAILVTVLSMAMVTVLVYILVVAPIVGIYRAYRRCRGK